MLLSDRLALLLNVSWSTNKNSNNLPVWLLHFFGAGSACFGAFHLHIHSHSHWLLLLAVSAAVNAYVAVSVSVAVDVGSLAARVVVIALPPILFDHCSAAAW